jgi:4-amino-4-deoxy-L-arabinose transferase-like glycosyltransferase
MTLLRRRLAAIDRHPRRLAALIALAAGLHGVMYIPLVSTHDETDSWSYLASANAIRDGSYTTPLKAGFYFVFGAGWFDITGARIAPSAWQAPERQAFRPPGYGAYVAMFGRHRVFDGERVPILLGHGVLFALGTLLLIATVRRWWGDGVALFAGLLYALDPWSKHYVPLVLSETLAGTCALAGVYLFTRAWETPRVGWWIATGAAASALALVRAVFVFTVPLVLVAALVHAGSVRERLMRAAAATVAAAVLLAPWLAWTNDVVGRPVMSVWGQAYNFMLAASGEGRAHTSAEIEAQPEFRARMQQIRSQVPAREELLADPSAHPRYLHRADAELGDAAVELYRDRLRAEPLAVAWEAAYRAWFLWNAHKDWYQPTGAPLIALGILDVVVVLLALAGSAVAVAGGGAGRAIVLLLGVYTLILATHHVEARFAIPVRGVFLSLVAVALAAAWGRRKRAEHEDAEPERRGRRTADRRQERLGRTDDEAGRDDARARGAEGAPA